MRSKQSYAAGAYRFKRFARKSYSAFNSMHKVVNIGVVTGCVLTMMTVSSPLVAQTETKHQSSDTLEKELDEVTITAPHFEAPTIPSLQNVTVINQQQIAEAPVQSIQDLLIYAANIDVIQRGGHGVQADISFRGGSADQTTILLNGINFSNPQTGHYSLDIPVNLSDIERIEVISGPSSLLYGVNSFSGAINIVTKKKTNNKALIDITAGMHNMKGIETRFGLDKKQFGSQLSVGYKSSDGYIANSDYDIYNVFWQSFAQLNPNSKINVQLGYNDKNYGANTFYSAKYPNQYERTSTYLSSINGEFGIGTKLKLIPTLYWYRHHDQYDLIKDSTYGRNYHRNDTYGTSLQLQYTSNLGITSVRGEVRKEDVLSSKLGKPMVEAHRKYTNYDDRINSGLSLEHILNYHNWEASAGALIYHTTLLKNDYNIYPSINISYRPITSVKIYSTWTKASRVPTFTDLYYTTETHNANESLKPEKSQSWDLGIKYRNSFMSADIIGYLMWGRDIIDWVKEKEEDKWASWNFTKLNKRGLELRTKLYLYQFTSLLGENSTLSLNYTRMHQTIDTKELISVYTLNYLRDKFTAQFTHNVYDGLSFNWFFRYQKRMGTFIEYKDGQESGVSNFPAFSTLDLKLIYTYDNMRFYLDLNNLYNTRYYDLGNIMQPGFWLSGGITYMIK